MAWRLLWVHANRRCWFKHTLNLDKVQAPPADLARNNFCSWRIWRTMPNNGQTILGEGVRSTILWPECTDSTSWSSRKNRSFSCYDQICGPDVMPPKCARATTNWHSKHQTFRWDGGCRAGEASLEKLGTRLPFLPPACGSYTKAQVVRFIFMDFSCLCFFHFFKSFSFFWSFWSLSSLSLSSSPPSLSSSSSSSSHRHRHRHRHHHHQHHHQ